MGLHYLPVRSLAWGNPALGSISSKVGLTATFKRASPRTAAPGTPSPRWVPADSWLHRRSPNTTVWSSLLQGHCSFLLGHGVHRFCLCSPKVESLFPPFYGHPTVKSCWPSKSEALGISRLFASSPSWKVWRRGSEPSLQGRTSLVLSFCSLWVAHPVGMGFDYIMIAPLLPSHCSFSFVFWHRVSFFSGFQYSAVNGGSTATCDLGDLTGDKHVSFSSPSGINLLKITWD